MSLDKLVYMANQIAKFFVSLGPETAAAGTADHIKKILGSADARGNYRACQGGRRGT